MIQILNLIFISSILVLFCILTISETKNIKNEIERKKIAMILKNRGFTQREQKYWIPLLMKEKKSK